MTFSSPPSATNQVGNLAILGSTGSVGRQTLDVVRANPGMFRVLALAAGSDYRQLAAQAEEFKPELVAVADEDAGRQLQTMLGPKIKLALGPSAAIAAAGYPAVHTVVCAMVGFAAFYPLMEAIEKGKHVALANKEAVVAAGPLIKTALRRSGAVVVTVDSEHSSIFQCLLARGNNSALRGVTITASGGPFLHTDLPSMRSMSPKEAVRHPRWNMGEKISVDSATLMNKGLEVIEASMLFDLPGEKIQVLIHPESVIHGFAEYEDGAIIAGLFETDMRVPIAFALSYLHSTDPGGSAGKRCACSGAPFLDLVQKKQLTFYAPQNDRFPALSLCYQALAQGGTAPAVLNAANEVAVQSYLKEDIQFYEICEIVSQTLMAHSTNEILLVDDVIRADSWARKCASDIISRRR